MFESRKKCSRHDRKIQHILEEKYGKQREKRKSGGELREEGTGALKMPKCNYLTVSVTCYAELRIQICI